MSNEDVIDYIMNNPENTNPNVLRNILEQNNSSITIDSALSSNSENPVQNKTITNALNNTILSVNIHATPALPGSESTLFTSDKTVQEMLNAKCIIFIFNPINYDPEVPEYLIRTAWEMVTAYNYAEEIDEYTKHYSFSTINGFELAANELNAYPSFIY